MTIAPMDYVQLLIATLGLALLAGFAKPRTGWCHRIGKPAGTLVA